MPTICAVTFAGEPDSYDEVRSARVTLEAALAVSDSEEGRIAWRVYHDVIARSTETIDLTDARLLLDEVILHAGDEELVIAKRRYDHALIRGIR